MAILRSSSADCYLRERIGGATHNYYKAGTTYLYLSYSISTTNTQVTIKNDNFNIAVKGIGSGTGNIAISTEATANLTIGGTALISNGTSVSQCGSHDTTERVGNITSLSSGQTKTITRTHSAQSITISISSAHLGAPWNDVYSPAGSPFFASVSGSTTVTVPAKPSYTVSYAANGGTSTPASQTKWYGENLTLQGSISKTGYRFANWKATNGTAYNASGTYSTDAGTTMTAQWTANTYTVVYNGNGNTGGSTASSSHTYDTAKNLTTNGFTRTNYLFKGWATSSDGPVVYSDGESVTNLTTTHEGTVNLYAVWEYQYQAPVITNMAAVRGHISNNVFTEDASTGTKAKVTIALNPGKKKSTPSGTFEYIVTTVKFYYKLQTASSYPSTPFSTQTISSPGELTAYITNTLDLDLTYDVLAVVQIIDASDVKETRNGTTFISTSKFILDISKDYDSISVFSVAPDENDVFQVCGTLRSQKSVTAGNLNDIEIYIDDNVATGTDAALRAALQALGWW